MSFSGNWKLLTGNCFIGCALLMAGAGLAAQAGTPPNIVIILADDLGYGDLGALRRPNIRTPRLDAMAAEGQKWTSFYVQPVCSPSRAALLTGGCRSATACSARRPATAPKVFRDNAAQGLPPDEVTIAEAAEAAGIRHRHHRQVASRPSA